MSKDTNNSDVQVDEEVISEKMFAALSNPVREKSVSIIDKKSDIVKFINITTVDARREIARTIKRYGYEKELKQSNSGIVVNLGTLPEHIIDIIYDIVMKFVN